jgi:hypothetical protein
MNPTPANVAALHELHARRLRELGDEETAEQADERADRARQLATDPSIPSSVAAIFDAAHRRLASSPPHELVGRPQEPGGEDRSRDAEAGESARRAPDTGAAQAQYAGAALQRAEAALQRAVERSERIDAHEARDKAGRERSAAARRRLRGANTRAAASALRSQGEHTTVDERRAPSR